MKQRESRVLRNRKKEVRDMRVQLQNDRIVLRYEVPMAKSGQIEKSGGELLIVHDVDVTGDYVVLHKSSIRSEDTDYDLMWKGNLTHCLAKFSGEVDSWESDLNLELVTLTVNV